MLQHDSKIFPNHLMILHPFLPPPSHNFDANFVSVSSVRETMFAFETSMGAVRQSWNWWSSPWPVPKAFALWPVLPVGKMKV